MAEIKLVDVVDKLRQLIETRKAREKIIAEMKEQEEKLKAYALTVMNAQGQATIRFDGIGRLEKTTRDYAEIVDKDQMAMFIYSEITKAYQEKRPLSEGLSLMQSRAALGNTQEFLAAGYKPEQLGVEIKQKETVKFVK
ncbi:TPA: hypothetical protein SLO96_002992 [Proteus mirabilis]|nr:hypothetical protein [Proteus mirabilis]